jgi:hypothetical protein
MSNRYRVYGASVEGYSVEIEASSEEEAAYIARNELDWSTEGTLEFADFYVEVVDLTDGPAL